MTTNQIVYWLNSTPQKKTRNFTEKKNSENNQKLADIWRKLQRSKFKIRNCFSLNFMCFKNERQKNWREELFFRSSGREEHRKSFRLKDKTNKNKKNLKRFKGVRWVWMTTELGAQKTFSYKWAYNQIVESIYLYTFLGW